MKKITDESIYEILVDRGFVRERRKINLFLTCEPQVVTPAFLCNIIRRRGRVAIGGAVGLFFPEFESIWANSISKEENQIDTTLPIVKLIENFNCLIDSGILRYNELDSIGRSASIIYDFISFFPKSIDEFYEVLLCKELLGKSFSSYLHIVNYNDDDNLYYRKSVSFIYWFIKTYPQYSERMYECLSHDQQQRLGFRSS